MEDLTKQVVARFIKVLQASSYDMVFVYGDEDEEKPKIRLSYSPEQLLKAVGYMKKMNMDHYHIYCRPAGLQYILLDDMEVARLQDLAKLKPCLLIETSTNNYQAWLKLKECPADYETALNITRTLQTQLNADRAAVSPKQVGRLPGFTNRKSKYVNNEGQYPFVKLRKWANRYCVFTLSGGACSVPESTNVSGPTLPDNNITVTSNSSNFQQYLAIKSKMTKGNSQSEVDFGIACGMIRAGKENWEISARLEQNIPGRRKGKYYIQKTIENARKAVAMEIDRKQF